MDEDHFEVDPEAALNALQNDREYVDLLRIYWTEGAEGEGETLFRLTESGSPAIQVRAAEHLRGNSRDRRFTLVRDEDRLILETKGRVLVVEAVTPVEALRLRVREELHVEYPDHPTYVIGEADA